jgi:hypothetical protein
MRYIDPHIHMISRVTDDYHRMAMSGCAAVNEPLAVGRPEPPAVPPSEEFADCWRGAVECVADPPPSWGDGLHACRAGDFRLFGDAELMERVRLAAESIHFGPYRGTGEPTPP